VTGPLKTHIYAKSILNDIEESRREDINFRLSFDVFGGRNKSEQTSGLGVVTVSRNDITEQWLSLNDIEMSDRLANHPKSLNSGCLLSKFMIHTEFLPNESDICLKIPIKFHSDKERCPNRATSEKSLSDAEEFPNIMKDENLNLEKKIKTAKTYHETASICINTLPSDCPHDEKAVFSPDKLFSTNSEDSDDSAFYRKETKESSPTAEETERLSFVEKAAITNHRKSVKFSPLLRKQEVSVNKSIPIPRPTARDWTVINAKVSVPHFKKRQSSQVPLSSNPRKRKMKLRAKVKSKGKINQGHIDSEIAKPVKVAEWSVQEILVWLAQLDPNLRHFWKAFKAQRIDGQRLLVLTGYDLLNYFTPKMEYVQLILSNLEELVTTPPEFGCKSKEGNHFHRYKITELMHVGEFSTTHLAIDMNKGNRVCALKLVCKKKVSKHLRSQKLEKLCIREVALKKFFSKNPCKQHRNMISFYAFCEEVWYRGAMYDWVVVREHHMYNLGQLTEQRIALREDISRMILHQIVSLLCFFREFFVGHFDLQPRNLLVQEKGWIIKVAGWSNYRQFTEKRYYNDAAYSHVQNLSAYMAPELYERRQYGLAADSWSLGAVIYQLVTGYLPFKNRRRTDPAYNALFENNSEAFWNANTVRTRGLKGTTKSALFNLLKFNPEDRLDIANVKHTKYFQGRILSQKEYGFGMRNNFIQLNGRLD